MIIIAAWKNNKSGLGHVSRAKKYFKFLKLQKKRVKFIIFKNPSSLLIKIKDEEKNIILIDSYVFSKKLEFFLKNNFKKTIIINDNQFKLYKDFYLLDSFKYSRNYKRKKIFLGQEYSPIIFKKKNNFIRQKKNNELLIILNKNKQKIFYKIEKLIRDNFKEKIVINVLNKDIRSFLKYKRDYNVKSFLTENQILNYAAKSKFIITPGGQTMMNLVENNFFVNVYQTSKNQNFYINELNNKKNINKLNFSKFYIKENLKTKYNIVDNKNKLLRIFKNEKP